jgi:hypothetical protein
MIQKIDGEYRVISQKISSKDGWAYQGRNLIVEMINCILHVYVQWLPSWELWWFIGSPLINEFNSRSTERQDD